MLLVLTPNAGASCGMPATWFSKSLNISFDLPLVAWHVMHLPSPKNTSAPRFSASVIAFCCAAREPVDRRIGERQRELELGDGAAEHVERNRRAAPHFRKHFAERQPVSRRRVEESQSPSSRIG